MNARAIVGATLRAIAYLRYSSDQQRATSIDDQLRNCRKRAEAEGWELVGTFADAAISGADNTRPEYRRMLQTANDRGFDVLLVDDLSRLARDSVEQEHAIRRLEFQGVRIVSVTDGYDSESKARKIIRAVHGMKNEIFLDDLREKTHRGLTGQALKGRWCGGRPYGYKLRPILDPDRRDAYGQPERVGTVLELDPDQAPIVREIFERYADGASCLMIAKELNERRVPSPGSTWNRKARRCKGWMGTAIRVIVRNPLYTGEQRWNTSQYVTDPDTKKYKRRARPRSEWCVTKEESLRIVSDELFARAANRTKITTSSDERFKAGGKSKYLLSGLLTCESCSAHFVVADARSYACSSYLNGRACTNTIRVRRDTVEEKILGPVRDELLSPQRIERMAAELEQLYAAHQKALAARAAEAPRELQELDARIARLKERLRTGDPDMAPDEIEAAIARAEAKRRELEQQQPAAKATARLLALLPRAAEIYRQQVERGLEGDTREALKARAFLRGLFVGGKILMSPGPAIGELWARFKMQPAVLLKAAAGGAGSCGSGGVLVALLAAPASAAVGIAVRSGVHVRQGRGRGADSSLDRSAWW